VRLASPWVNVRQGQSLVARGSARAEGDVTVFPGIELGSSLDPAARLPVHGEALAVDGTMGDFEVAAHAVPGFDRARLFVLASALLEPGAGAEDGGDAGGGSLALDDLALVPDPTRRPRTTAFEEFELHQFGSPPRTATLVRIDRLLLSGIAFSKDASATPDEPEPGTGVAVETRTLANGLELRPSAESTLTAIVAPALAGAGVATLGAGGRSHARAGDFVASDVTAILLGESPLMVRLGFEMPVRVRAWPAESAGEGAFALSIGPVRGGVTLQLSFRDERNRAADLAEAARQAARADQPAECLARWDELLKAFPFDANLTHEAREARGRYVEEGLDRVEAVRTSFDRARFFDLPDIYREELGRVGAIRERYRGSEVEEEAARLEVEIERALADHVDVQLEQVRARLARVAAILESDGALELARHVRANAGANAGANDGAGGND
jgi:hypothetical protein